MAEVPVVLPPTGNKNWKQFYDKSCGAVCLLCAALETNRTNFPKIGAFEARKLTLDVGGEGALYYITSGAASAGRPAGGLRHEDYSMPSKIVEAARHIGFTNATIYMETTVSTLLMQAFYATELQTCRALAATDPNLTFLEAGKASFSKRPHGTGGYKLVVVSPYMLSLHYVLHRPNGSYMDPASGTTLTSMPLSYSRTGLSIVLT